MHPSQPSRPPVGRQTVTPKRARKANIAPAPTLPPPAESGSADIPHDIPHYTAATPDPVIQQAQRDINAGLVDTDMRATPGLDAALRAKLVPGPGGKPPAVKP